MAGWLSGDNKADYAAVRTTEDGAVAADLGGAEPVQTDGTEVSRALLGTAPPVRAGRQAPS